MLITPSNLKSIQTVKYLPNTQTKSANEHKEMNVQSRQKNIDEKIKELKQKRKNPLKKLAISSLLLVAVIRYSIFRNIWNGEKELAQNFLELMQKNKQLFVNFVEKYESGIKYQAQHIDFKPANSIEEAKAFAKNNLNIENFDADDLEIANWINSALVKYSNKFEGKRILPRNVVCKDKEISNPNNIAEILTKISEIYNSTLRINKESFENFDETIDSLYEIQTLSEKLHLTDKMQLKRSLIKVTTEDELNEYAKKCQEIYENKEKYSRFQKKAFFTEYTNKKAKLDFWNNTENCVEFLKTRLTELPQDINEMIQKRKFIPKRIKEYTLEFMQKTSYKPTAGVEAQSEYAPIWHELGHLAQREDEAKIYYNDSVTNIKNADKSSDLVSKQLAYYNKTINKIKHFFIGHTPMVEYKYKLVTTEPYKFEFDEKDKFIAKMISEYAASSPDEFVAETFASLMEGNIGKFNEDIINAYKRFKGPLLDFFEKQ